ncbi:hypothetical protein OQ968_21975 [Mycobacterium sp. 663a-19]|uniref:hypothetical protein n=1 Tax=Mycobacterium sp. 663a-19 TaxID=2986148 RepID=UPI002D1F29E3|nr:hypothetical protein [Mycobacterium sp. 663a-19]MEB3983922.1 hypothetical protein [Mycobacterium sp. 663a-19]
MTTATKTEANSWLVEVQYVFHFLGYPIEEDVLDAALLEATRDCMYRVQEWTLSLHALSPMHILSLTYPVSNLLLGVSNALVRRAEADKKTLSLQERTEQSGNRDVEWKTQFPGWTGIFLNKTALRPAHWLQKRTRSLSSDDAHVIYAEYRPPSQHRLQSD